MAAAQVIRVAETTAVLRGFFFWFLSRGSNRQRAWHSGKMNE
jgi:hypothetical protein